LPLEEKIGERRDTEFTEVRRKKEKGKRKKEKADPSLRSG
jgi:hypothetical protein